jgi:hypothetical protein
LVRGYSAHIDGVAAADVRPQRSPHCEQTAVIIGPLRDFACSACGAQSGHASAIAFNYDLRTHAFWLANLQKCHSH